jgi:hypothetical protein
MEGLGQLKIPTTSLGTEPVTFRLATQCLNQLYYLVPHIKLRTENYENKVFTQNNLLILTLLILYNIRNWHQFLH